MTGFLSRLGRNRKQRTHIWSAVVVAAGTASRMEGIDKILTTLGDLPVLVHTLRVFEECPDIAEVVVVTREDLLVEVSRLCREFALEKVSKVVVGGKERIYSVQAGLAEVRQDAELIAIHDGARPLLPPEVLKEALDRGAAGSSGHPGDRHSQAGGGGRGPGDAGPLHPVCRPNASSVSGGPDPGCYPPGGGGGGGAHRRLRCGGAAGHEGLPHPGEPGKSQADHPL